MANEDRRTSIDGDQITDGTITPEELDTNPVDPVDNQMLRYSTSDSKMHWDYHTKKSSTAPMGNVTPDFIGQRYIYTDGSGKTKAIYVAKGTTSSDWELYSTYGTQRIIWVDGNRTDTYTEDGTEQYPFKTVKAAMIFCRDTADPPPSSTNRFTVHIRNAFYYEDNPIPAVNYVYTRGEFKHNPRILPNNQDQHLFEFPSGYCVNDFGELTFKCPSGDGKCAIYAGPGAKPVTGIYYCLFMGAGTGSVALHNSDQNSGFHFVNGMSYGTFKHIMEVSGGNYWETGHMIHAGTVAEAAIYVTGTAQDVSIFSADNKSNAVDNYIYINSASANVQMRGSYSKNTKLLITGPLGGHAFLYNTSTEGGVELDAGDVIFSGCYFTNNASIKALTGNIDFLTVTSCTIINEADYAVKVVGGGASKLIVGGGNILKAPSGIKALQVEGSYIQCDIEGTEQAVIGSLASGASYTIPNLPDPNSARIIQVKAQVGNTIETIAYNTADEANYYQEDNTKTDFINDKVQLSGIGLIPYAHWHLNETSGTSAADSSGNGRNGTTVNMEDADWVSGKLNNCLNFGGTDEYLNCGYIGDWQNGDWWSLECWFNTSSTSQQTIMGKVTIPANEKRSGYCIDMDSSGHLEVYLMTSYKPGQFNELILVRTSSTFNDGSWHHLVVTYDGSDLASGVNIYIDNSLQSTSTIYDALGTTYQSTSFFEVGGKDGTTDCFVGKIDEIVIYTVILSTSDISYRYNSGNGIETMPGTYDTTQGWYVTTLDASQINTSAWAGISQILIESSILANTSINYLVSVDDRTTWKYWDGQVWQTSAIGDIDTNGNDATTLQNLTQVEWDMLFVAGTFDIAASLKTTSAAATPELHSVKLISVSTEPPKRIGDSDIEVTFMDTKNTKVKNLSGSTMYVLRIDMFKVTPF